MVRQQFVKAPGRLDRQPLEDVLQVRVGFMPVAARRVQHAPRLAFPHSPSPLGRLVLDVAFNAKQALVKRERPAVPS